MRSIIAVVALVSSVSLAQQPEAPKSPKPPIQNIDFNPSELSGTTQKPLGNIYFVPPKAKFGCLIQVRMNFNDKLAESVHEM